MATRWTCPQCLTTVLGPTRPRSLNTCRFCLKCSANATVMVQREPVTLLKHKAQAKADERHKAKVARLERKEAERQRRQRNAADYAVAVEGRPTVMYDALRGKDRALEGVRQARKDGRYAVLSRIKRGVAATGVFHGPKLVAWDDGTRTVATDD